MQNPVQLSIEDNGQRERASGSCPHLGVIDDRNTWLNFPNPANLCFQAKPAQAVVLEHQASYCLSPNHTRCPVFSKALDGPLPLSIGLIEIPPEKPARPRWIGVAAVALVFIGAFIILSLTHSNDEAGAALAIATQTAGNAAIELMSAAATQTALAPSATPLPPTETPTPLPSATPTVTPSPSPSPTPAPTQFAALGEPFGRDGKYVLYELKEGESLENVATAYNTKSAVIWAANELIVGASVRPGTVLLLLPGVKDPNGVVKHKVVKVKAPTLAKHIAAQYGVSVEILVEFNQINPEIPIPGGRWLIFPAAP